MTYKELVEQVKKDCQYFHDTIEGAKLERPYNRGAQIGISAAYETVIKLIETYEKRVEE